MKDAARGWGRQLAALALGLLVGSADPATADGLEEARGIYAARCASCHGTRRYGGYAPPLLPTTLARRSDAALAQTIRAGLPNTQMPGFGAEVDATQAAHLVQLLREPVGPITWSREDMAASRVAEPVAESRIPDTVSRDDLILVVERGTGSISILDGRSLEELDRFFVGPIHGGPKFDQHLRKVFASTRDGTLVEYDLDDGGLRTRIKVGVNTRNIAVTPNGRYVAAANQLPPGIAILDGRLHPLAWLPLEGQPSAVYAIPGEERLLVALRDRPLLYRIDPTRPALRARTVPEPFEDFAFVPGTPRVVASARGGRRLHLYDLELESDVASLDTEGLPHLFSACFFRRGGVLFAAFNHVGVPRLSIVDMRTFRSVREIPLRGAGYFARTHPGTPYIWADTNTDQIQLVRKDSLELLDRGLTPEPGRKAMHVEFTADGRRALVSVWHDPGAVVVYDSRSLEEVTRLPYAMPVGKYNAHNKTRVVP